jgi:hypothetical protein
MATPKKETTPAIIEQVKSLPLPAKMIGTNLRTELDKALEDLRSIPVILDEADKLKLNGFVKNSTKLIGVVGDKRLEITRIFDGIKKLYQDAEALALADLSPEHKAALQRVLDFDRAQLKKRRDEEARLEQERQQSLARKRAASSIAAVEEQHAEKVAEVHEATAIKGASIVWKYTVQDAALIPREYCVPDPAKIAAAVKNGTRTIAGVHIYEDLQRTGK